MKTIDFTEGVEPSLVRENLAELQLTDTELGRIIQLRWISTEQHQVAITCTTDDEDVENRPSPQTEGQKDDEVVTETATPPNDSSVASTVDEATFRKDHTEQVVRLSI